METEWWSHTSTWFWNKINFCEPFHNNTPPESPSQAREKWRWGLNVGDKRASLPSSPSDKCKIASERPDKKELLEILANNDQSHRRDWRFFLACSCSGLKKSRLNGSLATRVIRDGRFFYSVRRIIRTPTRLIDCSLFQTSLRRQRRRQLREQPRARRRPPPPPRLRPSPEVSLICFSLPPFCCLSCAPGNLEIAQRSNPLLETKDPSTLIKRLSKALYFLISLFPSF